MRNFIRYIDRATVGLGTLSGMTVLIVMLIVCGDVVGRSLFNVPLVGATESSELLLACLIFFGLAAAQQRKQHYMVELVVVRLPPRIQVLLMGLTLLMSAGVTALLCWYSVGQAISSYKTEEIGFGTIEFLIWPARTIVAFGLGLFSLQYLIQFFILCGLDGPSNQVDG